MIPPWPAAWPTQRKIGFGFLATIPLALLVLTFFAFICGRVGVDFAREAVPVLAYTHIGAQFITLLIFGHLMTANPALSSNAKMMWGAAFLFLAPFAIATYWVMHVWGATAVPPPSASPQIGPHTRIHVYDYDYSDHRAQGTQRREDGVLIHHIDVTSA